MIAYFRKRRTQYQRENLLSANHNPISEELDIELKDQFSIRQSVKVFTILASLGRNKHFKTERVFINERRDRSWHGFASTAGITPAM